jgi:transposase
MNNSIITRAFGSEISGNRRSDCELSENTRLTVYLSIKASESKTKIAKDFGIGRTTVYETFKREEINKTFKSKSRKGRSKKLNERNKRYIL